MKIRPKDAYNNIKVYEPDYKEKTAELIATVTEKLHEKQSQEKTQAQKIKENHIKKVERYLYYKKDSVLNKTFLYDSSGNLIKEIMYGRNSIANSVDSMIYDDNNHRIKHYSKSHHQDLSRAA